MKIRGNTVGTTMKRSDFNQTDPKKSDYIKNNPIPLITEDAEGKTVKVENGVFVFADMPSGGGGDSYSRAEIDAALGDYITDIDTLIGEGK